ncbi:MAG: histidine--tRNA ligase [Acidibrevibacterium sp.]|uniref:histidine--tRNA ligase n=1 Tax=Acidibrevibacterium sp. TaxID=2606776 RepID=UPI003CFCF22A
MPPVQPPRGTHDLIGEEQRRHRFVTDTAREVAARYGFEEWVTPIFEKTEVFARTLGETSDVVTKEMYTFPDRGGDSLTLRPEGTAGVCRALVSNGLTQTLPQRVFYAGPMFRYERPQKGRFRQFHQIGVELLGPTHAIADAEVIACGYDILRALGIADEVRLEINTLGDDESRRAHRAALITYMRDFAHRLSDDSRIRLEKNPLRILDSKDPVDQALVAQAPKITDYLTVYAREYYDNVKVALSECDVAFIENPRIVRGLDYYSHTAFEFVTERLGAQGTVLAGGRYQDLLNQLGGGMSGGVGFAAGIERLAMLLHEERIPNPPRHVSVISPLNTEGPLSENSRLALKITERLRRDNIAVDYSYWSLKRALKRAADADVRVAVILGSEEVAQGAIVVRDLRRREQTTHDEIEDVVTQVRKLLAGGA